MRIARTKTEYGGYLPLELNDGREFFEGYEDRLLRFNSVKAALDRALRLIQADTLYIPIYYCPSTTEALCRMGVAVRYYHIGKDLLPESLPDRSGTAVLLVNFFGIMDDAITVAAESFRNAAVILDQAHAFYCPPLMRENVFSVYSARKFFGVPDGAYLIGEAVPGGKTEDHVAGQTAYYLLKSYEQGTNAAYAEKKQADADIAAAFAPMSNLARGLLKNADYESVRLRRLRNFAAFHTALSDRNKLEIPAPAPAYVYPFLSQYGQRMKPRLVADKIYVPTLWKSEILMSEGNTFEQSLSDCAVFLPIDQRYGDEDTAFLINAVEESIF